MKYSINSNEVWVLIQMKYSINSYVLTQTV